MQKPSSKMKLSGSSASWLKQGIIFILTAIVPVYRGQYMNNGCPSDVGTSTRQCWNQYDTMVHTMFHDSNKFYSGVDAEHIRLSCSLIESGIECAKQYHKCPQIEVVLYEYGSVMTLCLGPNNDKEYINFLLDVYARSQTCLSRLSESSKMCYETFESSMHSDPVDTNDIKAQDPGALRKFCGVLGTFSQCVQDKVRINCIREAVPMVDRLVRASVPLSAYCQHTPSTPSPGESESQRSAATVNTSAKISTHINIIYAIASLWIVVSMTSSLLSNH